MMGAYSCSLLILQSLLHLVFRGAVRRWEARGAYTTLLANETGSEIECGDLPKHGDRKGSPLLYNGLASLLRGCKMILALPSSGCFALFLSFANKVLMLLYPFP